MSSGIFSGYNDVVSTTEVLFCIEYDMNIVRDEWVRDWKESSYPVSRYCSGIRLK
jgi:hypothetical protein